MIAYVRSTLAVAERDIRKATSDLEAALLAINPGSAGASEIHCAMFQIRCALREIDRAVKLSEEEFAA